ncbi:MAG: peptidoglycan editing factor PgeF [Luteitalea sp.]|nr:peptidoglycan editing factor PgeF [Luteitalea sp.]
MILPTPGASFRWRQTRAGAALVCEPLERFATHLFTSRTWKLGSRRADLTDHDSWAELAVEMAGPLGVTRVRQVHGRGVVVAKPGSEATPEGDILIASDARLAIAVQAADCVPLLFVDPVKRVVAAAHAGWRGMAAGVPQTTLAALEREFGCRPEDLRVAAGPSIGACCYEVGSEVRNAFMASGWTDDSIRACFHDRPTPTPVNPSIRLRSPSSGCWFFDGWECTRRQLEAAGVLADRIHSAGLCTASHPEAFPSYRRDGDCAGRIAGAIRLA